MNVSKKLLWQQGLVAQYAEINLDVEHSDDSEINTIVPDHIQPHWSNAIRFGVALFAESYTWQQPAVARMTVRIQAIKAVPGDTSVCSLAYVTFQALCSAWNIDGEKVFAFDRSSGNYSFSRPAFSETT